jgi:hypothetical protein
VLELLELGGTSLPVIYEITLLSLGSRGLCNHAQTPERISITIVPRVCVCRLDKQWRIFHELLTGWRWEHVLDDGNVFAGPRGFRTYIDCFEDARRNGCFEVDLLSSVNAEGRISYERCAQPVGDAAHLVNQHAPLLDQLV